MVWKPGDGSWPLQQPHPAQSGEQQPFSGSPWSVAAVPLPWPCPFSHPPGAVAVPLPLLRARMDSWLSPFWLLEQPKISDLVQEEPVPPSHGAQPQACPAWLILFSVLCCWISKTWKTAGCGGQAEPPTSTCPGLAWFWSLRRTKEGLEAFVLPFNSGRRKIEPWQPEMWVW